MEILSVRDLSFGYIDCPVFEHFSCSIEEGDFCLIEGENGAGKTTLMKCITSLINKGACIYYREKEIINHKNLLSNLTYVMSDDTLYDYLTVDENIRFFKSIFGENKDFIKCVCNILCDLDVLKYKDFLVKNLSQGTRSKVYLAIILAKHSDVLLLDEPFTALDQTSQKYFCQLIKNQNEKFGKTIVLITHIAQFKELATKTINISKKEV